jgi:hypothetical protein
MEWSSLRAGISKSLSISWAEKRARIWDLKVTCVIVIILFIPLPFVRVETWPQGEILFEKPITPWSEFRICCLSYPGGEPVEEIYGFNWRGKLVPYNVQSPLPFAFKCADEPLLKWQKDPEISLNNAFLQGDLINAETFWQPFLFWPFRMIWQTWSFEEKDSQRVGWVE